MKKITNCNRYTLHVTSYLFKSSNLTVLRSYGLTVFLFFSFCFQQVTAQPWANFLPKGKTTEELTLQDYRKAFHIWESENENSESDENGETVKDDSHTKFKRWEYRMEGLVDSNGHFPVQTGMQVVREHKKTNPKVYASTHKSSNWSILGPFTSAGGYAGIGRINCIAFHPTNPDIWWVGAASGGLWVTTNNGASWSCLTDDNGVLGISDIVIPTDFATSNTIYIATGDRDAIDNYSIGVLKSTNNGATWQETGLSYSLGQGRLVNRLLLDPNDNNTLIAATNVGVFKTTDGGDTWNTKLSTQNFIDMEFKPGDFNTLYGSNGYYASGAHIWRTTDGGDTWNQVLTLNQQRTEIAVTPANPNVVYAVVSNNASALHGVYKSTNSGESFQQVAGSSPNMLGWNSNGSDSGGQGWFDLCIAISPTNADIVLIGGVNTWRSMNGGTDWNLVNVWSNNYGPVAQVVHADKHALVFRNDGVLFEGNDGGIYISQSNGTSGTWVDKTNGMQISQMYKLGCSATHRNEIITGLQDNGTKLFYNNNWYDVIGGDGMECLIDYSNVNVQYGSLYYGDFRRTLNRWGYSTKIAPTSAGSGAWVTPLIIHPKEPQTLYAGYSDLFKTTDRGDSWTKISNINTNNKLRNIAICESNPDVIYMADYSNSTYVSRIWRTLNGGENWTLILTTNSITSLCVKNDDPNTVWYTRGGYNSSSVFQSTDGGINWKNISEGLPEIPMYSLVYNKLAESNEQLYVGSEVGVYFKDGDNDWVAFNNGLPNVKIGELEIYYDIKNPEECRLRAATFGRGLWESPIQITTTPVAGTVTGTTQLCEKEVAQLFLIGSSGEVQWQESLNNEGWKDIDGANTTFYQSDPLTESKYFRAKVTLGTTVYSNEIFVEVSPVPEKPIITKTENSLTSSATEGNQWYNQDGLIPGATGKNFTPIENGTYFTIVTLGNCSSEPSNSILIDDLSIGGNAIKDGHFTLFPNPTNEQLRITNYELRIKRVILIDMLGKEVINSLQNNVTEATINLSKIPTGIYQVKIETETGVYISKIVKQ